MVDFVDFKHANPMFINSPGIVPISRTEGSIGAFNFPLIHANALAIHKSQGSTYSEDVCFDFGVKHTSGLIFTRLTRVKGPDQVKIRAMDFEKFNRINTDDYATRRWDALV